MSSQQIGFYMEETLLADVDVLAKRRGIPRSQLIRETLQDLVDELREADVKQPNI